MSIVVIVCLSMMAFGFMMGCMYSEHRWNKEFNKNVKKFVDRNDPRIKLIKKDPTWRD